MRAMSERQKPVRDGKEIFHFMPIPSFSIGGAVKHDIGGGKDVIAGYYRQEQKLGARFHTEFKPDQVKKAWSTPYVNH